MPTWKRQPFPGPAFHFPSATPRKHKVSAIVLAVLFTIARRKCDKFTWNFADIEAVIWKYADRDIDFADATLIWLANLINAAEVMTIDRADFEVYRLANGKSFSLALS